MEITSTTKQGKSIVSDSLRIEYNVMSVNNKMQDVSGSIFRENNLVGFVSYDCLRGGFQLSLNPENGLSAEERKKAYIAFTDDIEQLITD